MVNELVSQINWLSRNAGASDAMISNAEKKLHARFSDGYKEFLKRLNGGNSRTCNGENICLFSTDELPEINTTASIDEFLPGWLIFASDLGGKSYLFRREGDSESIVSCFDEVFGEQALIEDAKSFLDFLQKLGV